MRYRLRTLMIVLALGPPVLAGCAWAIWELTQPAVSNCTFTAEQWEELLRPTHRHDHPTDD